MWVKLCGIRDISTAEHLAALSPDAIGLNFYARSPRSVSHDTARRISAALPPAVEAVGVFVNATVDQIVETVADCSLSTIQLHGDEPPEFLAELQSRRPKTPLLRAWRMGADLEDLDGYLAECRRLHVQLAGCLIDARVDGSYGGTGRTPPWDVLRTAYRRGDWPRLILAGGLTAENVAEGIRVVQPWGVDVASGVESAPGIKDLDLAAKFVAAARSAA